MVFPISDHIIRLIKKPSQYWKSSEGLSPVFDQEKRETEQMPRLSYGIPGFIVLFELDQDIAHQN